MYLAAPALNDLLLAFRVTRIKGYRLSPADFRLNTNTNTRPRVHVGDFRSVRASRCGSDGVGRRLIEALLIAVSEASKALLPSLPQHPSNSVQTLVQVLQRGAKRDPDKVMAGRVEEVSVV